MNMFVCRIRYKKMVGQGGPWEIVMAGPKAPKGRPYKGGRAMVITDKDIAKLTEVFATKEDLGQVKEELKLEIKDKFDQILKGQDKIIGDLEKAREDRVFAVGKDREQDGRLDELDGRVKKLEAVGR